LQNGLQASWILFDLFDGYNHSVLAFICDKVIAMQLPLSRSAGYSDALYLR